MSVEDRRRWDERWGELQAPLQANPLIDRWLQPVTSGLALDVACGPGHNSLRLAQIGYKVLGVDGSIVALQLARRTAIATGVSQQPLFAQVDLDLWRPPKAAFDLICVFRFLDRPLIPHLCAALREGGLLLYETRHVGRLARQPEMTRQYLLERGELRRLFAAFDLIQEWEGEEDAAVLVRKTGP